MIIHLVRKCLVLAIAIVFVAPVSSVAQQKEEITAEDILSMSLLELMELEVVTASKMAQKINEVPATVRVITADDILKRGYFTLEDALADLPGFQFRDIQGFNTYSFLRGIPNQNNLILVLIDGIQINELNSGGFYGGGQYNLANVEQIEVVYGPASALYGTNAVSGIINIITKKAKDGHNGYISQTIGSFKTLQTNVAYGFRNSEKDLGFRISGMYKSSDKSNLAGSAGDNNWTEEMENFETNYALDGSFQFKNFSAGINYQEKLASRTTNYKTTDNKYLDKNSLWDIRFINAHAQYDLKINDKFSDLTKVYYRNATVRDNTIGYVLKATADNNGSQVGYYRPNKLLGIENQITLKPLDILLLTGGILYEYELLAEGFTKSYSESQDILPSSPAEPGVISNNLLSLFAQEQLHVFKWFNIVAGVRQDFSTYYGNVFTPRLALIAKSNGFTGRLLYNEAFRSPRPWDFTSGIGNDDLKPENIRSTEINFSYLLGDNLMLEGSGYYNHLNGIFAKEYLNDTDWYWNNKDTVRTIGSEIGIRYSKNRFDGFINYSYNDSKDEHGEALKEIARHSANMGIGFKVSSKFFIHAQTHYYGKRQNPKIIQATQSDWIDPAIVIHANCSYLDFHGFDLQVGIRNLTNTEYYHTSNRPPDRYRQPQRSFLLTIRYHLKKNK